MAAISLKLPDDLKHRIQRLARGANKTPHAFMIEALAREVRRSELEAQRFADAAARSEQEALSSEKAFGLAAAFDYLAARAAGAKSRRPKPRARRPR